MGFWTGMRKGEIVALTWDKIDLKRRMIYLEPEDTKESERKRVPISNPLIDILKGMPNRIGAAGQDRHVFTYKNEPINDIRGGLIDGCKKANIKYGRKTKGGFTFHDLRHTFRTFARKACIDRNIVMVIMGHSDGNDMRYRYDTIDENDLRAAIDQFEAYLQYSHQTATKSKNKGPQKRAENVVTN